MESAEPTPAKRHRGTSEAAGETGRLRDTAERLDSTAYPDDEERSTGIASRALAAVLAGYKRWISPLLPPACRFTPTCSEYARMAILKYGVWRGGVKAIGRVCRCHPWHPGGVDLP